MKHIGVDIGGSHITAAQVDLQKERSLLLPYQEQKFIHMVVLKKF
jgi:predicted NBD/HSP70 family sugar kinase